MRLACAPTLKIMEGIGRHSGVSGGAQRRPLARCRDAGWQDRRTLQFAAVGAIAAGAIVLAASIAAGYPILGASIAVASAAALGALAGIDARTRLLPNVILYPLVAFLLVTSGVGPDRTLASSLAGAIAGTICGGFFVLVGALVAASKPGARGIGLGDLKLSLGLGLLLGFPAIVPALAAGVMLTIVPVVYALARPAAAREFAWGPWLILGALAWLGQIIVR